MRVTALDRYMERRRMDEKIMVAIVGLALGAGILLELARRLNEK
jgi:hypothetical protein